MLLAGVTGQIGRLRLHSPWLLALALAPLALDALLGLVGLWPNTGTSRTLTGLFAGVLGAIYLLPAATVAARELHEHRRTNGGLGGREAAGGTEGTA